MFQSAGFFRIFQPLSLGGLELPAATLFRLEIALAEADMSAAWVLSNMCVAAFHVALFDLRAQTDIWGADPDAILSSANMPGGRLSLQDDDTYLLSGRWRFSSGVKHADWVVLGALAQRGAEPLAGACLVPCSDFTLVDDWNVAGLCGTGSHAIIVQKAVVPRYRFLSHVARFNGTAAGLNVNQGSLYRIPLPQLLFRSISSASIGGLKGMLNEFLESNSNRTSMMAQKIADDPHVQELCGRVSADLHALQAGMEHDLAIMTADGNANDKANLLMRRNIRLNVTRICDICFGHAADLLRAAGASALYRGNRLLIFFNDMLAARQHAANQYELHARNDGAVLFDKEREDMLL